MIDPDVNRLPETPANPFEGWRLLYLRVLALVLLLFGLRHWIYLVGIYEEPGWNFETMSNDWRFATINLAVVGLVAAVGLWMNVAWGIVLWAYVVVFEIAMHTVFADRFGVDLGILAFHGLTAIGYVALAVMGHRATHQASNS